MAKSNFLEAQILDHVLTAGTYTPPTTLYVALYSTDPTDADTGTELTGNGYARQTVTFAAAAGNDPTQSLSNATVTFTASGGNWATATHCGIRDALTGGNLLYHSALDAPVQINDGSSIVFDPGQIVATES